MIVLGIDPSIVDMGFCIIDGKTVVGYGEIKTKSSNEMHHRLTQIQTEVESIMDEYKIEHLVIEAPDTWTRKQGRADRLYNPNSMKAEAALNVDSLMKLSRVIGIVEAISIYKKIPYHEYKVSKWKGHRTKQQTEVDMCAIYSIPSGKASHVYDALGITHYFISQKNLERLMVKQEPKNEK